MTFEVDEVVVEFIILNELNDVSFELLFYSVQFYFATHCCSKVAIQIIGIQFLTLFDTSFLLLMDVEYSTLY